MVEQRLSVINAKVERLKKPRQERVTQLYQRLSKRTLFEGGTRSYQAYAQDGDRSVAVPTEEARVQERVVDVLEEIAALETELTDAVYHQDVGNQGARVDITLEDGTVLAKDVPVTHLMYLRKRWSELRTIVAAIPVHNAAIEWVYDANQRLYRSKEPARRQRTQKMQRPLVLYPATDKHPAQTQLISEDVPVGEYNEIFFSGCESAAMQNTLLRRVDFVLGAINAAILNANSQQKVDTTAAVSRKLFDYVLQPLRDAYKV